MEKPQKALSEESISNGTIWLQGLEIKILALLYINDKVIPQID